MAEEVRKYRLPDFSNWKNHDAFEKVFGRLEKDLRTRIGKCAGARRSRRFTPRMSARQKFSDAFFNPPGEAG